MYRETKKLAGQTETGRHERVSTEPGHGECPLEYPPTQEETVAHAPQNRFVSTEKKKQAILRTTELHSSCRRRLFLSWELHTAAVYVAIRTEAYSYTPSVKHGSREILYVSTDRHSRNLVESLFTAAQATVQATTWLLYSFSTTPAPTKYEKRRELGEKHHQRRKQGGSTNNHDRTRPVGLSAGASIKTIQAGWLSKAGQTQSPWKVQRCGPSESRRST